MHFYSVIAEATEQDFQLMCLDFNGFLKKSKFHACRITHGFSNSNAFRTI